MHFYGFDHFSEMGTQRGMGLSGPYTRFGTDIQLGIIYVRA
jgi:hypothetical protein